MLHALFRLVTIGCIFVAAPAAGQTLPDSSPADEPLLDGGPMPSSGEMVARDAQGRVTLRTLPLPSPLRFDGRLDEPFYETTPPVSDFIQQEPNEGQIATERTEAWVFFDEEYLYIAARCWESDPSRRVMSDMRRDAFNLYNNDHFGVMLDTFYDRRGGYSLYANAQGGMFDAIVTNESPNNNWNGLWDVRTADFEHGWTIEFRIPFRSLRFKADGTVWGINFRRMVRWKNEVSFLTPIPASYSRRGLVMASFAGSLLGIRPPVGARNLDIKPYVLASSLSDSRSVPAIRNDGAADFGVDAKWGITQEFVADVTYNTDFAQVEDDEQQVNLTRFSLFFPEKREFFLEGQEIFSFGGAGGGGGPGRGFGPDNTPVLFFSRRIGLDAGRIVPILAGGRLLGRAGPYQLGAMAMRTAAAGENGIPSNNFSVVRLNRDVMRRSRVGMLATRRTSISGRDNYAYGADAQLNVRDTVSMTGYWARTDTPGRRGRDTSYRGRFDWNADRYGLEAEHLLVGSNFNPEIGFVRRQAFRRSFGQARFSPRPQGLAAVRKLFYEANLDYITSPSGEVESKESQGSFRMELASGDMTGVQYTRSFEALDDGFSIARGVVVPAGAYTFQQVRAHYFLGPQRPISGGLSFSHGSFYDGTLSEIGWRGRAELSSRFYAEPTISWNRFDGPWGAGTTTLVSTRLTYTLSPRMFVATLAQFQSQSRTVATNARFRWEYLPGSELFIVYSDGRNTLTRGFPRVDNRSIVVKATRLFRW